MFFNKLGNILNLDFKYFPIQCRTEQTIKISDVSILIYNIIVLFTIHKL